jgi:ATP-dependent DNA helicase DinG
MTEAAVTETDAESTHGLTADASPDRTADAGEEFVLELLDRAVSGMGGQSRDGQHEMARQVARAIDSGDHLLVRPAPAPANPWPT